jgi:hypothetical protein
MTPIERTVVGVDVGGMKKGFHAVALRDNQIVAKLTRCSTLEVATWCRQQGAAAVGIDAPCQWSLTGRARSCERELAGLGMSVFCTPSQAVGEVHPFTGGWSTAPNSFGCSCRITGCTTVELRRSIPCVLKRSLKSSPAHWPVGTFRRRINGRIGVGY